MKIMVSLEPLFEKFNAGLTKAIEGIKATLNDPHFYKAIRQRNNHEFIKEVARRERRIGKAAVTKMFDDLYAELGLERDDE